MQNKSMLNTVLLVIIIILLVVGLGYFFFNNSKQKENSLTNNLQENNKNINPLTKTITNQNKVSNEITSTKNYKNINYGYSVDYPTDWQSPTINESPNGDLNFEIQNISDSYTVGYLESLLKNNASIINISVGTSLNGISYANYSTIEDSIKDSRFVDPSTVQSKLSYVSSMNIGGQTIKVMSIKSDKSENYKFIFNGKFYTINFTSGSQSQYSIDYPTFENFLSSFTLL